MCHVHKSPEPTKMNYLVFFRTLDMMSKVRSWSLYSKLDSREIHCFLEQLQNSERFANKRKRTPPPPIRSNSRNQCISLESNFESRDQPLTLVSLGPYETKQVVNLNVYIFGTCGYIDLAMAIVAP